MFPFFKALSKKILSFQDFYKQNFQKGAEGVSLGRFSAFLTFSYSLVYYLKKSPAVDRGCAFDFCSPSIIVFRPFRTPDTVLW